MSRRIRGLWLLLCLLLTGCSLMNDGRLVYDQHGIRIGIEADPTVSRSDTPALNNHPARLTPKDLESLLGVIRVSGWSGTLAGLLTTPRPVALFRSEQLSAISPYLVVALEEAKPNERIFFSLPKPDVAYSEDRTEGSLFLRGRYLHMVVTDHSAFLRADTGGGEPRDIRDTKGMKLSVAEPVRATMVPDLEEPQWAPFEKVHLSLYVKEILAQGKQTPLVQANGQDVNGAAGRSPSLPDSGQGGAVEQELQRQVRELTNSNLELRGRLQEQNERMRQLTDHLEELRHDLDRKKSKPVPKRKAPEQ